MMSTSALIRTIRKAIYNELVESSLQALLQEPITSMSDHTARELHIASNRIAAQCVNLVDAKSQVEADTNTNLIDSALEIHDELEQVKDGMRAIRRDILQLLEAADTLTPITLRDAIVSLGRVVEDAYAAANQLQWEIAEHDATYAPRGTPLIVRNQDELDQALDSMRSEK
jgi:hypothetical protein